MRSARLVVSAAALILAAGVAAAFTRAPSQDDTTVIRASTVLDGAGATLKDVDITVRGGKIVAIDKATSKAPAGTIIDLRGNKTVLPGLIDAHSHLTWYFNAQGRYHTNADGETPAQGLAAAVVNAHATLMAGFTTVQSPGSPEDLKVREMVEAQGNGPRILTSLQALQNGDTARLRSLVQQRKQQGADLIKLFASASIRDGGTQTLTAEQVAAVCDEAKKQGLRTIVHAHSAESMRTVINAGCDQIEHGVFATQAELDLMAAKGTWFDPQCSLVFRNYLDNRAKYDGIGNYNEAGFAAMEKAIPMAAEAIRKAWNTKGLKMTYGTDAVAGAHGRNAEDLVCRVQSAGEPPMHALVSATSVTAQSMGLGDKIGRIKVGMDADIIALDGDPLKDITVVRKVGFVMRGGKVRQ
ncbi:MAG: amidohydrolase family protein [Gemmatimonadetes bacterium]|nr:amidohydrolase family protein [Gemmatimonadota bacterium]